MSGIKADTPSFLMALLIYGLISIPSDLFLMNHMNDKVEEAKT